MDGHTCHTRRTNDVQTVVDRDYEAFQMSPSGVINEHRPKTQARAATSPQPTAPNSTISWRGCSPKPDLICQPNWPTREDSTSSATPAFSRALTLRPACKLTRRIGEGGDFTASPWGYNGKIFCLNDEGRTFVIAAGEKYELLGSNDLDEMALSTPALIGDRLILRAENHLYSIRNIPSNNHPK